VAANGRCGLTGSCRGASVQWAIQGLKESPIRVAITNENTVVKRQGYEKGGEQRIGGSSRSQGFSIEKKTQTLHRDGMQGGIADAGLKESRNVIRGKTQTSDDGGIRKRLHSQLIDSSGQKEKS